MPKVKANLKEWGLADWPTMFKRAIKSKTVTIKVEPNPDTFDAAIRKIGKEIIEAFLHDTHIWITENGVEIGDCNNETIAKYSPKECHILVGMDGNYEVPKWMKEQLTEIEEQNRE